MLIVTQWLCKDGVSLSMMKCTGREHPPRPLDGLGVVDWGKTIFNCRCCKLCWACPQDVVAISVWQQLPGLSWGQLNLEVSIQEEGRQSSVLPVHELVGARQKLLTYLGQLKTSRKDAGGEGDPLDFQCCSPALWLPGYP